LSIAFDDNHYAYLHVAAHDTTSQTLTLHYSPGDEKGTEVRQEPCLGAATLPQTRFTTNPGFQTPESDFALREVARDGTPFEKVSFRSRFQGVFVDEGAFIRDLTIQVDFDLRGESSEEAVCELGICRLCPDQAADEAPRCVPLDATVPLVPRVDHAFDPVRDPLEPC
jgi:hypothetical protein